MILPHNGGVSIRYQYSLYKRNVNFINKGGTPMGEITNRDAILNKVSVLFEKMHQNQKLQQLAEQNNLDIKNAIKLTDDNMMNVAVTLVALSLAKEANDPRYKKLVNTGLQKRSLKLEIINDYKKEANDIIKDYSSGNFNKEPIQEGFLDIFKPKPKEPVKSNSFNENEDSNEEPIRWKDIACDVAYKWYEENIPDDLKTLMRSAGYESGKLVEKPHPELDNKCFEVNGTEYIIKRYEYDIMNLDDWGYDRLAKGFLWRYSNELNDPSEYETLFKTHKDDIPVLDIISEGVSDSSGNNWSICYRFQDKEYYLYRGYRFKDSSTKLKLGKSWTKFVKSLKDSNEDDIQQEGFLDIFKSKPKESPKPKRVPQNLDDVAEMIGLKDAGFDFPEDFKKGYESESFKKLLEDPDFYVQGEIKCWPNSDIRGKKNIWKISILDYKHLESWNSSNGETGVVIVCGVRNDEWIALNCEDGKYYLCASSMNECDSDNLMFNNFKEFSKFLNGKHFSKEEINKLRNDESYEINEYL